MLIITHALAGFVGGFVGAWWSRRRWAAVRKAGQELSAVMERVARSKPVS